MTSGHHPARRPPPGQRLHDGDQLRVLDWGDASISHPFASLVVTFRFLDEINHLPPGDPWFARLRDAYLEPWGSGLVETFALAQRTGIFAHAIASLRQRAHFSAAARTTFDEDFRVILRRALSQTEGRCLILLAHTVRWRGSAHANAGAPPSARPGHQPTTPPRATVTDPLDCYRVCRAVPREFESLTRVAACAATPHAGARRFGVKSGVKVEHLVSAENPRTYADGPDPTAVVSTAERH